MTCFHRYCLIAAAYSLLGLVTAMPSSAQEAPGIQQITLDKIMADPEWLGRPAEGAYWADDSQSIFYDRKRAGQQIRDSYEADLDGNVLRVIEDKDRGKIDSASGVISSDGKQKVWQRSGDLFLKDLATGKIRQLTRTQARESSPQFTADGKGIVFSRDNTVLVRNLRNGFEEELVVVKTEEDPAKAREKGREGYLPEQQQKLFEYLRKVRKDEDEGREANQQRQAADPTRTSLPIYLGSSHSIGSMDLSLNGRWCLVVLKSKQATNGENDKMPEFVHESGYVNSRNVRPLVGTGKSVSDRLVLIDIRKQAEHEIDLKQLPGITDDPLADVKASNKAWLEAQPTSADDAKEDELAEKDELQGESPESEDKSQSSKPENGDAKNSDPKPRAVQVGSIAWSPDGDLVAIQFFSADNKDRWICSLNIREKKLDVVMHRRDPAWINWNVGSIDWLSDNQSISFISEETGYAHLYVAHIPSAATRQLTSGEFVVRDVQHGLSGKYIYYKANQPHPGIYEIYRVDWKTGEIDQLTNLGGMNDYKISPDEKNLLVIHSTATSPEELWIQPISDMVDKAKPEPKQITLTVSAEFKDLPWIEPQFITVQSRSGKPIHARLYLPPNHDPAKQYPAVIFIHGAGYLQNAHQGWSGYFREFMFHSLLAYRGYVVLDMDYRASAGYGRDWRTAIYRHMGGPELEDLKDGKDWLVKNQSVAADRVGLYGGSYGGFLTLMALFRQPNEYACGAALRPVTDWVHYNHGYTSNILNTPEMDPEAYVRSSPIEFAEGLEDPLLMCHGMVDDNVFFKDTVRLAQRLIELKKKDWEVAVYPVEPHGFVQPSSWYDEYRRIFELFEENLK